MNKHPAISFQWLAPLPKLRHGITRERSKLKRITSVSTFAMYAFRETAVLLCATRSSHYDHIHFTPWVFTHPGPSTYIR